MKLTPEEFKRFKELQKNLKSKKGLTPSEEVELKELAAKKNEKGSNDIKWWDNYPELTDGACNVPFNYIPGVDPKLSFSNVAHTIPFGALAVVSTYPTIGVSNTTSDAFNAQMRQLWLDMHRKYRGMGGYQRSDLGMAILAISELFATVAKFERIYAVVNTYKIQNRNIPAALYEGLSIAAGLEDDLADFRYGLNVRISKMQQLCLPKGIAAVEAKVINTANIFKDSANPRASLFCFDPYVYAIYDPTTLSTGGCVKYRQYAAEMQSSTPQGSPALSKIDMFRIIDDQLQALLDDDDIAKMCSDLIAAYGPENVLVLGYVPELYTIEPVLDYERQLQFHNLTICGDVYGNYINTVVPLTTASNWEGDATPYVVYQNNDVIMCELDCVDNGFSNSYAVHGTRVRNSCSAFEYGAKTVDALLDTWVDKPGTLEIMCGTRFLTLTTQHEISTGDFVREVNACGLDVVREVTMYHVNSANGNYTTTSFRGSEVDWANVSDLNTEADLINFDWHPLIYYYDTPNSVYRIYGDIDNFAVVDIHIMRAIHNAALYSVFKIPKVSYIN